MVGLDRGRPPAGWLRDGLRRSPRGHARLGIARKRTLPMPGEGGERMDSPTLVKFGFPRQRTLPPSPRLVAEHRAGPFRPTPKTVLGMVAGEQTRPKRRRQRNEQHVRQIMDGVVSARHCYKKGRGSLYAPRGKKLFYFQHWLVVSAVRLLVRVLAALAV